MPETTLPTPEAARPKITDAVCINTARVYDSCADRSCVSGLPVTFTDTALAVLANAVSVRPRSAEILNVFSEIERVPFNTGYYSVDATYYFRVLLDVYTQQPASPETVEGLCVYSKKSILYGADGSVKMFSSEFTPEVDTQAAPVTTNPRAVIQVASPILLAAQYNPDADASDVVTPLIPESVGRRFNGEFRRQTDENAPLVSVTIGLFSIVRMERDVQLLIPAYDFCRPTKQCAGDPEDPCDAFSRMDFPMNEFFPPEQADAAETFDPTDGCTGCRE